MAEPVAQVVYFFFLRLLRLDLVGSGSVGAGSVGAGDDAAAVAKTTGVPC